MTKFALSILFGLFASNALAVNLRCDSTQQQSPLRNLYFSSTSDYAVISLRQNLVLNGGTLFKGDYYVRKAGNSEGYLLNIDPYFSDSNETALRYWLWFGPTERKLWVLDIFKTTNQTPPDLSTLFIDMYDCKEF